MESSKLTLWPPSQQPEHSVMLLPEEEKKPRLALLATALLGVEHNDKDSDNEQSWGSSPSNVSSLIAGHL